MKPFLIATLLVTALSAPACAAELVTNGGFESVQFTGWSHTFNNLVGASSLAEVHSGTHAAMFGSTEGAPDTLSQSLATVAGQTYTLSFWTGSESAPNAPINSDFQGTLNGVLFMTGADLPDFPYFNVVLDFVANSNATVLAFTGFNDSGYYLLDDISVTGQIGGVAVDQPLGVPEPASWALMTLGVGMAGACLRRRRGTRAVGLAV